MSETLETLGAKVDNLAGQVTELRAVVIQLARVEEKLSNQITDTAEMRHDLAVAKGDIETLKVQQGINTTKGDIVSRWVERLVYFLVAAALGAYGFFKGP